MLQNTRIFTKKRIFTNRDILTPAMQSIYFIATQIYFGGIRLASFFSSKARLWWQGRIGLFEKLERDFNRCSDPRLKSWAGVGGHHEPCPSPRFQSWDVVWMHCASLGEFEQGRPLLEALKKERPHFKFLLTFFSPSGYEIRKNYPLADWVHYLPADSPANARRFFDIVQPGLILFVKYEFWHFFLSEAKRRRVPLFLVSAIFRDEQPFFQWYGKFHRGMLASFTHLLVQDSASADLLAEVGFQHVTVTGDTRVDRVLEIASHPFSDAVLEIFCEGAKIMICGSTREEDARLLAQVAPHLFGKNWKMVIAPHEIQTAHIQSIEQIFGKKSLRYSEAKTNPSNLKNASILILDNVGMLSSIYRFGKLAWIGGGFGKGIHNTLEPAAYGLPVFFGANYRKFREAVVLVETGGAFSVKSPDEFLEAFEKLTQKSSFEKAGKAALNFMLENRGATAKSLEIVLRESH